MDRQNISLSARVFVASLLVLGLFGGGCGGASRDLRPRVLVRPLVPMGSCVTPVPQSHVLNGPRLFEPWLVNENFDPAYFAEVNGRPCIDFEPLFDEMPELHFESRCNFCPGPGCGCCD